MYYLKSIKAENLFSWKDLYLEFDRNSAYSLKGENGSGKSSIFEIIIWALYKKTTKKNVKGNFGKDDGMAEIVLSDGKKDYSIQRESSVPTQVLMNNKNITQEYLEEFLGGNYSVFMASNYCSQKRVSSFINESSDSGKAKIFGEMLGCDIIDKMRTKVQKQKNSLETDYEVAKTKVDFCSEAVESIKVDMESESVEDYQHSISEYQEELETVTEQAKALECKYEVAVKRDKLWDKYEMQKNNITAQITRLKQFKIELEGLEDSDEDIDSLEQGLEKARNTYQITANVYSELVSDKRNIQSKISELKDMASIDGTCPSCGSTITEKHQKHIKAEIQKFKIQLDSNFNEIQQQAEIKAKQKIKVDKLNQKVKSATIAKTTIVQKQEQIKELRQFIKTGKESLNKPDKDRLDAETLLNKSRSIANKVNELKSAITSKDKTLTAYNRALTALETANIEYKDASKIYNLYNWLFKHLPLMKLRYINDNKLALEDVINQHLSKMGIPFVIKIETSKEMKSTKEIKEAFSFQIISTIRKHKADKKDLSGGEETCILLSTQFGISDIAGSNLDFEIYDEVYGSLDNKNLASVVDALNDRAKDKQMFSISHKDEISHSFNNIIKVEKINGYSKISK